MEAGESPDEAAVREVLEETGVRCEVVSNRTGTWESELIASRALPVAILDETPPTTMRASEERYLDFVYAAKCRAHGLPSLDNSTYARWFSAAEIARSDTLYPTLEIAELVLGRWHILSGSD